MKAYSKGAKRRNHKTTRKLYEHFREEVAVETIEKDDPQATVREARARQTGRPEKQVLAPMLGEDAGRAIDKGAVNREEARRMWEVWDALEKARRASVFHTVGRPMFPAVAKIEYMPERFETRDDFTPDLRTEEERHMAAMNNWRHWRHVLGFLSPRERYSLESALWQRDQLHLAGALTVHGVTFVASMRALVEVVDTIQRSR